MSSFRVLYLDMNSFFASVEQQLDPALRGRPVAITAVDSDSGACVAASYEAKAHGVKTGIHVRDARRLCPGIILRPSRHRLYVRFNLAVADVLDRHAELTHIRSVDEFQLALSGEARTLVGAVDLVARLKAAVAAEVGDCLRFSAGIGPNHLLAKIAGKLEKPDGCQWLGPDNLPAAIAHLSLDDLPGISTAIKARLFRARVFDVPSLFRLDPRHARLIWRSVEGERFVRMLQGMDIPLVATERGGFGNSKVLSPEYRDPRRAYLVGRWLVEKATARLRRDGRVAGRFSLSVSFMAGGVWSRNVSCFPTQDTAIFLRLHRALWVRLWRAARPGAVISISVHLGDVGLLLDRRGDLLMPLAPAELTRGEQVSRALDQINARHGDGAIRFGLNTPHPGFFERGYLRADGTLNLLVDSTGIKFLGDGEWQARKHGVRGRRQWRKVHLAMDAATSDIRAVEFNPSSDGDSPILLELLNQIPEGEEIGAVTADGADDTRRRHAAIIDRQAKPIIPIRKNGRPWKKDCPAAITRNETLRATRHYGRAFWKRWTGYHVRSRIEAKMRCLKAFGGRIAARDPDRQTAEIQIRIALVNRFNSLGTAEIVRVE